METKVVTPLALATKLAEHWSPKVIAEFDNNFIKVAKVKGTLAWHSHEHEDELFYVLQGQLKIELRDQTVELQAGDMYVVPKGIEHNPIADEECLLMLVEQKNTLHTGEIMTEKTRSIADQLEH